MNIYRWKHYSSLKHVVNMNTYTFINANQLQSSVRCIQINFKMSVVDEQDKSNELPFYCFWLLSASSPFCFYLVKRRWSSSNPNETLKCKALQWRITITSRQEPLQLEQSAGYTVGLYLRVDGFQWGTIDQYIEKEQENSQTSKLNPPNLPAHRYSCQYKSDSCIHLTWVKHKCCSSCCFLSPSVYVCVCVCWVEIKACGGKARGSGGVNFTLSQRSLPWWLQWGECDVS